MNKMLMAVLAAAVLAASAYAAARTAEAEQAGGATANSTEPVAFTLKYRGLDAPDDPLSYRSYWGFGALLTRRSTTARRTSRLPTSGR